MDTVEAFMQRLVDAFEHDMEQGVAWLNDEASKEFARRNPKLLAIIVGARQHLNSLTKDEG